MGVVVGMHAALIFVIANAFGLMPKAKIPEVMTGEIVENTELIDEEPPPHVGPPNLTRQEVSLPAPDDLSYETDTDGAINVPLRPVDELITGPVVPIRAIGVRADPRNPLTQPIYPPEERKAGREGAVVVEVFVQPDGRVADARIHTSSGFESFDRSTLREARTWRMLPAMRGDEKIAQWHRLRVVFKLENP